MNSQEIRKRLSAYRVGIAGAGGLGSNCAVALARCGVGTIVICDFDRVEEPNLNRQYFFLSQCGMKKTDALKENIYAVNPAVRVITHDIILDRQNIPVIFEGCDVIVEAFDRAEMKEMIIDAVQTSLPGVPLIVGSGLAGWGRNDALRSRKIDDTLYICGDETSETSEELPPLAPRVGIVASMQANIVLEILLDRQQ